MAGPAAGLILLAALAAAAPVEKPKRVLSASAAVLSGAPTSLDYPARAIRRGAQGMTRIAFRISAEGKAEGCRIVQSSGDSELDWLGCRIAIGRMTFRPALDEQRQPTWQDVVLPIDWRLEPFAAPEPAAQTKR